MKILKGKVKEIQVNGWAGFRLSRKRKLLKGKIKDRTKNYFGDTRKIKESILEEIQALDKKKRRFS